MDVMEAIRTRRSVRKYLPDAIPDEQLATVLEAAQLAPTACNNQPFKIIVVKDAKLREQLVPACKGQKFVADVVNALMSTWDPESEISVEKLFQVSVTFM